MEKNLKAILELRNQIIKLYDNQRFRETNEMALNPKLRAKERRESFEIAESLKEQSTELLAQLLGDYMPIIAIEDCVIEPGETKEVETNILQFQVNSLEENELLEFSQEGIISTYGYLSFELVKDYANGNKIMVTNHVSKEVYENYDLCVYCYETPTTTKYFRAGVYEIKKGQMIGVLGLDPERLKNRSNLLQDKDVELIRKRNFMEIYENHKKSI